MNRQITRKFLLYLLESIAALLIVYSIFCIFNSKPFLSINTLKECFANFGIVLTEILAWIVLVFVVFRVILELRIKYKLKFYNSFYGALTDIQTTALYKLDELREKNSDTSPSKLKVNGNICKELIKVGKSLLREEIIPFESQAPLNDHNDSNRICAFSSGPAAKWFTPGLVIYLSLNAEICFKNYSHNLKQEELLKLLEEMCLTEWSTNKFCFIRFFIYDIKTYNNDQYLIALINIHRIFRIPFLCLNRDNLISLIKQKLTLDKMNDIMAVIKWQLDEEEPKLSLLKRLAYWVKLVHFDELHYWIDRALQKKIELFDFVRFDLSEGKKSKSYSQDRLSGDINSQNSVIHIIINLIKNHWDSLIYEY